MEKGFPTLPHIVFCRLGILIKKHHSYFNKKLCNINFFVVWVLSNIAVAIIYWHERHRDVLQGMHSPLVAFCLRFRSFWLCLIVFVPMICLNDVFLRKAMSGVALKTAPNALLIFDICQYLLIISLIFGNVGT